MDFQIDNTILSENERLLFHLLGADLIWKKDLGKFTSKIRGIPFEIGGSHIQKRGDTIVSMMGCQSRIIESYWKYDFRMALGPNQSPTYGLHIQTGDFGPEIDQLLSDLYWEASHQHHNQSLSGLLQKLNEQL